MHVLIFLSVFSLFGCTGNKHFIEDKEYRDQVEEQFNSRKKLLSNRDSALFTVFNERLNTEQEEALRFLYAYMPLSDLADYNGQYFLDQVNLTLEARDSFSWGTEIPEDILRHFVLPIRVNNENLDTARTVFFNELRDRVKNLTMEQAALEVNHWCHEKVNYRASDARTSSPLASIRTSFGRCGEESTFTVAAMRSVCIPARQVYTPRWAHTDDNHAWVEVFVDNKWQYLGACEPEPVLNKGWFDVPVKRAMMVYTNVIGRYTGTENVIAQNDLYTRINSLSAYTVTKNITIKVLDSLNKPVEKARVAFGLYNYAEFYPMVVAESNADGYATLETGLGDLQIWVSKNNTFGYSKVSVGETDTMSINLNQTAGKEYVSTYEVFPPVEKLVATVTPEKQEENNRRLLMEDSIRNAYMATFMKPHEAIELANKLNLDTAAVKHYIALSYGNWREIKSFLEMNASNPAALDFLGSLAEKDIRDTPYKYLNDHLKHASSQGDYPANIYHEGILSARIHYELIRPWRSYLQNRFTDAFKEQAQSDISVITSWVKENISLTDTENYMGCPISPIGVYEMKLADKRSRDIFFVALCRSTGIASRIDPSTYLPQVYQNGGWQNISFESKEASVKSALLTLESDPGNEIKPEYYIHYTLQKFEDGKFTTLDYEGSAEVSTLPATLALEEGYYQLMTGHRKNDGSVLVRSEFFNLTKDRPLKKSILLEPFEQKLQIAGVLDLDQSVTDLNNNNRTLSEIVGTKGLVIAFINPNNEPTKHIMNDIPLLKADFEKWGGNFLYAIPPAYAQGTFNAKQYSDLPKSSLFAVDTNSSLLMSTLKALGYETTPPLPFVLYINPKGEVLFTSMGYRIGIGENLLKASRL